MTSDTFQTMKNLAIGRGDTKRSQELATYSLANREQSFDAAAEQLAYLYRLMGGNWPKALAAYNFGPGLMNWFDGKPVSISKDNKPVYISKGKWEEISVYLAYALRGASEDPQSADGYVLRPPNQDRTRDRIYRPAVPSDTIRNP
jgi:soluble lytic murein transglycosylase-like protein